MTSSDTLFSIMLMLLQGDSCLFHSFTITKRSILELAGQKLGGSLHQIQATLDNDDLLSSICMDVQPHGGYAYTSRQECFMIYTMERRSS